jgi:cell division FtsZ-interacting protein ZapD
VGVRTLGDLLAVLERGEVEKELAAKIRKVLEK